MADKFEEAFNKADGVKFHGFRFDDPDMEMLIVHDEDFLEHLQVQAAGMAYYTALYKQCERKYDELEKRYKYRYNEMYRDCSETLIKGGKKNNVKDIEGLISDKYQKELAKMDKMLDELRTQRDNVFAFLEGWKQKSYALSNMADMIKAGFLTPKETITQEEMNDTITQARNVIGKFKEV